MMARLKVISSKVQDSPIAAYVDLVSKHMETKDRPMNFNSLEDILNIINYSGIFQEVVFQPSLESLELRARNICDCLDSIMEALKPN
jgi:hypothetical protein